MDPPASGAPVRSDTVLLLSSPRAGSTLLRVMLAGHPDVFAPPELNLLLFDVLDDRPRAHVPHDFGAAHVPLRNIALRQALRFLFNGDERAADAELARLVREPAPIGKVFGRLHALSGRSVLVDKSPSYTRNVETLRRAEEVFDRPRYLHLTRHPYAVIESFVRRDFHRAFGRPDLDAHRLAEAVWTITNANVLEFLGDIEPERQFVVRYEDLVGDPRASIQGVLSFLGVPFDEGALNPYAANRMADGVGDPGFLSHVDIDASLAEAWRRVRLPRLLDERTRRVAKRLRYEIAEGGSQAEGDWQGLPPGW